MVGITKMHFSNSHPEVVKKVAPKKFRQKKSNENTRDGISFFSHCRAQCLK